MGHTAPPEEVAEGKPLLPDVNPAIFAIIFPICVPTSLAPGSPLPTALQYAQPEPNCHVFIYPVLCTRFLVAVLNPRTRPTIQQQSPNAQEKEKKPIEILLLFKHN